jgi:hypothetical protein
MALRLLVYRRRPPAKIRNANRIGGDVIEQDFLSYEQHLSNELELSP